MKQIVTVFALTALLIGAVGASFAQSASPSSYCKSASAEAKDKEGNTDLMRAARDGDAAQVKSLITSGASLKAKNKKGWTPLMIAAFYGKADCVGAILDASADVNARNGKGETALVMAVYVPRTATYKTLPVPWPVAFIFFGLIGVGIDYASQKKHEDHYDAGAGDEPTVKELLASNAKVDDRDMDGMTALIESAAQGNVNCVNDLIAAHADVKLKRKDGNTALIMAAINGNTDCVKALIAAGADVNAKGHGGKTALMLATSQDVIALLRTSGETK